MPLLARTLTWIVFLSVGTSRTKHKVVWLQDACRIFILDAPHISRPRHDRFCTFSNILSPDDDCGFQISAMTSTTHHMTML